MKNRYQRILEHDSDLRPAVRDAAHPDVFDEIAWNVVSPVLILYTLWIVTEAEKQGISRLYFLARDGYLMREIAETLCQSRKNGIRCSYFFCSRYALRMAAYRFCDETAYDRLFLHAYRQTVCSMLERAGFDADERKQVCADISFPYEQEQDILGRAAFDRFCEKVRASEVFRRILAEKSEAAYPDMIAYIRQEGMGEYETVGIVDLGWTGSLQAVLRRLLDSAQIRTKIVGFYMGMLDRPPAQEASVYRTWLFSEKETGIKSWFSHNLMECICSAPHGMTMGYRRSGDRIVPVLAAEENPPEESGRIQQSIAQMLQSFPENACSQVHHRKTALQLLKKLMYAPTIEETNALSRYRFCDDVGEQYHRSIVQTGKASDYRRELLLFKPFCRDSTDGFYWYYGSVAASGLKLKTFYRHGYLATRYIIMKLKRR